MALTLPLYGRCGAVLFLDDDQAFLEMLGHVLPQRLQVHLYAQPNVFLDRMRTEPARWEADASQHVLMVERWRQGRPLIPQLLRYWAHQPQRYDLVQVCSVDYAMPGMNGLMVLDELHDWPGARVLLTGQADEQVAVQAFNSGLIDHYISKVDPSVVQRLTAAVDRLCHKAHPRLNTVWRAALQPAQCTLLQVPSVTRALQTYAQAHWVEYAVLGAPFGLLGLDANGGVQWLQLEPLHSLADLAELARSAGLSPDALEAVMQGEHLPAIELHQQLQLPGSIRTAPAFMLDESGLVKAAAFDLAPEDLPEAIYPYRHFLGSDKASRTLAG